MERHTLDNLGGIDRKSQANHAHPHHTLTQVAAASNKAECLMVELTRPDEPTACLWKVNTKLCRAETCCQGHHKPWNHGPQDTTARFFSAGSQCAEDARSNDHGCTE